jgi:hypothetical protein
VPDPAGSGVGNYGPRPGADDPVGKVCWSERTGGRHDHRPEFGDGEGGLPELDLVAQHQHDAIALANAEVLKPRRHSVGALGHRGEADALLAAIFLDNPQRGALVAPGDDIEPVGGPVEGADQMRPRERAGEPVVVGHGEDLVTHGAVPLGVARHGS